MSEENANYIIDEFDKKLLELLHENSRMKNTDLARRLKVTEGAIRKRIKKLVESKYVEKFTIKLNESKIQSTSAIVQIQIAGDIGPGIIRNQILEKVDGVEELFEVTGEVDLFCLFKTFGEYKLKEAIETLRGIEGITSTKTFVALNRIKIDNNLFKRS